MSSRCSWRWGCRWVARVNIGQVGADEVFEARRGQLLAAVVDRLETALPDGTPSRVGARRGVWDVLCADLTVGDVSGALRSIAAGPGGELTPTAAGNIAMCSAESSALMAVNFLAGFPAGHLILPGVHDGTLSFERELRVAGVRAPVGPTLDVVHEGAGGTVAFEVKTAEPWRGPPRVSISAQYDDPARAVSASMFQTLDDLRASRLAYHCLDAAQLVKHLLGIHSNLASRRLPAPAKLILLYWRPSNPGRHAAMFDLLASETADFAGRVGDQLVDVEAVGTNQLLDEWSHQAHDTRLAGRLRQLRARYDQPLEQDGP